MKKKKQKKQECISIALRFVDNYAGWDFIGFNSILIKF